MPEPCLTVRTIDRLFIVRQNEQPPTEDDWDQFLRELGALLPRISEVRAMVFSDGGGPTAEQRKRLASMMNRREVQTAVISDKSTVRFVVATIGLFNKSIKTYSWDDVGQAYAWLGLSAGERRVIESTVAELGEKVRSKSRASIPASASADRAGRA